MCNHNRKSHTTKDSLEQDVVVSFRALPERKPDPPADMCPECGSRMEPNGRCFVCRVCGFSKCG